MFCIFRSNSALGFGLNFTAMKSIIIGLCLFFIYNFGNAQHFYNVYDFEDQYEAGSFLTEYDGRLFGQYITSCNIPWCSEVFEMDYAGNLLWKTTLPHIFGTEGFHILEDTIFLFGDDNRYFAELRMAKLGLDGTIYSDTTSLTTAFLESAEYYLYNSLYFDGRFLLFGAMNPPSERPSFIMSVNRMGQVDTTLLMHGGGRNSGIWDGYIDDQGYFVSASFKEPRNEDWRFERFVHKFDSNLQIVWEYQEKDEDYYDVFPWITPIKDGGMVFSTRPVKDDYGNSTVKFIDSAGVQIRYRDLGNTSDFLNMVSKLITLKNGDVMVLSDYTTLDENEEYITMTWLIRMDPNGHIKWQRRYRHFLNNEETIDARNINILELENSNLMIIGELFIDPSDMFILSVDSNGCMGDNCTTIIDLHRSSGVHELAPEQVELWPNPVYDVLNIRLSEDQEQDFQWCKIIASDGREVFVTEKYESIEVHSLEAGIYFVEVLLEQGRVFGRFVKGE